MLAGTSVRHKPSPFALVCMYGGSVATNWPDSLFNWLLDTVQAEGVIAHTQRGEI